MTLFVFDNEGTDTFSRCPLLTFRGREENGSLKPDRFLLVTQWPICPALEADIRATIERAIREAPCRLLGCALNAHNGCMKWAYAFERQYDDFGFACRSVIVGDDDALRLGDVWHVRLESWVV